MKPEKQPSILVIGAGMSGMLVAMKLIEAGFNKFRIFEKDHDVGGTWRINTYPGIACDVPSHYYTYKNEPNSSWSSRLPQGSEIQDYLVDVCEKHKLRQYMEFEKEVIDSTHDGKEWTVKTNDGQIEKFDFVIACCGLLFHPSYPNIEGLKDFKGHLFHSARWDHDVDLEGKKVGLIGTGSTGAQIISTLAKRGIDLTIFLRTPQWIFPLPDQQYSGFTKKLFKIFPPLSFLGYWFYRLFFENVFGKAVIQDGWQRKLMSWACRKNLESIKDENLRARLTPDFKPLCKRLVMSNTYYKSIQQDNVTVADGNIVGIEGNAIRTKDGEERELDVLILATGYDTHAYFRPMNMQNQAGENLDDKWAKGPYALRTVAVPGFPNFFFTLGPQSPFGNFSAISMVETQVDYIIECIKWVASGEARTLEPMAQATEEFNNMVYAAMPSTIWMSGCTNWYMSENGVPSAWPFTGNRFREELAMPDKKEFLVTN